ncbi:hypothetical protein MP638_000023 [Amoeboaphelidium occidentale]|nr:hypothetical protein MP638_000023 [Amoeboaphelidium occidentale]
MLRQALTKRPQLFATIRPQQLTQVQQRASYWNYFNHGNLGMAVLRKKDIEEVHHTDPGHDPDAFNNDTFYGKGIQGDRVPDNKAIATGKERYEYEMMLQGKDPYFGLMDPLDIKEKGTKAKPIEVLSGDPDRIVGCSGHDGEHHALTWLFITADGHKYWDYGHNRCPECGNTFKLKQVDLPHPTVL